MNTGIKCPNHAIPLEGIPTPPPSKGIGICPISKCPFAYECDSNETELVTDTNGNVSEQKKYNYSGSE